MGTGLSEEPANEVDKVITKEPLAGITWDEFYRSPRADVVLVSEDMVDFRVDSWYMKKKR